MERKKYKLIKQRVYSPIIAIMGGKNHTDYIPVNYGSTVSEEKFKVKPNPKGVNKTLIRNRETFNTQKY